MIYSMAALSLAPAAAMAVQVHTDVQAAYNVAKGGTVTKNLVTGLKACEYELNVTLNGKAHNATVSILSGSNVIATKDVTTTATDPTDAVATLKFKLDAQADLKLKVENKNANEAVQVAEVTLAVDWNNTSYVVETNKVFSNVKATVEGYQFYIDALGTPAKDRNGDDVAAAIAEEANTAKTIISDAASALGYIMAAADEDTKINLYNTYKVYDVEAQGNLVCDLNALDAKAKVTEKGYQYDVFNTAVKNLENGINAVDELIKNAKAASKEGFENRSADLRTRIVAYRTAVDNFNAGDAITFTDPADLADLESDFNTLKDEVTSDTQELALKIAIEAYLPNVQQSYEDAVAALNAALIDQTVQKPNLATELGTLKTGFENYKTAYVQHYNIGDLKDYENDQLAALKAVEKKFTDFITSTETNAITIANAKVEYNNAKTTADGKVTSLNTKYNENVTALQMYMKGVFTGTMLQNALDELRVYQTKNIPALQTKINDYYSADNVANAQLMAKESEITTIASDLKDDMSDIVTNAESNYEIRKGTYEAITGTVTDQQIELDGYNNSLNDEAKANLQSEYNRIKGLITALQGVVDALADDIDSYDITTQAAYTTIVSEVDAFGQKVTPANTEAQNYIDLKAAIDGTGDNSLVKKLAAAEALLKIKKADDETTYNKYNSTDGKFVASARFEWKRTELNTSIGTLATKVDNLYGNGTTTKVTDKLSELQDEIDDLVTAIEDDYKLASENAVSHYNTILADAAADIDLVEVVRADIKDLDVYTAAPYKYKDELDQIKAAAEKAQTDVAATLDKTGKESVDDLMAIVYASKQTRLNEIKTSAPDDQQNYLHDNAASLYSTLKVVVDSKLSELDAALDAYKAAYITSTASKPQPDLGLKRTEYDGLYNGYVTNKNDYDTDYQNNIISDAALATESTDDINARVNTFTTLQTNIATVKDNLDKLTRDADAQIEKVQAEKDKKVEVDELIQNNLTAVLANKKATVDTYETEAKNAIADVYTSVSNKISDLSQAVSNSRNNETLVKDWQTTTNPKLEATYNTIKNTDIPAYESKASNLNNNKKDFDALVNYYTNYKKQQNNSYKTLAEILQEQYGQITAASVGDGALTHYQTVLQTIVDKQGDATKGYIKQIADKHETQLSNMTYDANFKEQMLTAMGKLEQEAKDSVAAAGRNYRDYQAQAASKVVLQNLWNSVMEKVDADQTNKKAERVAKMNEYQQAINDLAVVMETYYPRGWSSSTKAAELVTNKMTSLTGSINAIAANYEDVVYDADLAQSYIDNRKAVDDELLKADQALSAAALAIAPYSSRTNAALLAAIKDNDEYVVVTNLIASYDNDKQAVNTQADAHRATAEGAKVRYDNTGDIADAQAIANNLNNAVTAFKNAIDAVIAGVWNDKKDDEVERITNAWNKIKDFAAIKPLVDAETPETLGKTKKEYFANPLAIIDAINDVTIKDPQKVDIQLNKLPEIAPAVADITTQATIVDLASVVDAHKANKVQADKARIRQLQFVSAKGNTYKITDFLDDDVIELEEAFDTDVAVHATTGSETYQLGVANKDLVDKRADILDDFADYDTELDIFFNDANGAAKIKLAELKSQIDGNDQLDDAVTTFNTDLEAAKKLVAGSMVAGNYDYRFNYLENRSLTDITSVNNANSYFVRNIFKTAGLADVAAVEAQYAGIDADFNTYIAQAGIDVEEAVATYQTPFLAAKKQIEDNAVILNSIAVPNYTNYAAFKDAFEKIMEADGIIAKLRGTLADLAGNAAYAAAITELEGALADALAKTVISNDPPQFLDDDFEALSEALNVQAQALGVVAETIESCKTAKTILSYKTVIAKQIFDINGEIDIILADVDDYKAAYTAHVALVAMNDRVKLALDEEIAGVQTALDNAKTLIEGYGVDDCYLDEVNDYQTNINNLSRIVNQMYKNLALSDIEDQETDITREDNDSWLNYLCEEIDEDENPYLIPVSAPGTWLLNKLIAANLKDAAKVKANNSIGDLYYQLWNSWSELNSKQMTAQMRGFYQGKLNAIDDEIDLLKQTIDEAENVMDYIGADYQLIGYADIAEKIQTALDGIAEDVQGNIAKDDDTPGIVDVADYRAMVNYVLQNEGYVIPADKSSQEFMVLDVNGDMQVNSADIVAITNIILYGNPAGFDEAGARSDNATALVNLTQESVTAEIVASSGNTKRIAVSLNNFREYSTYQMDITMPQGMTLVNMTLGERAANHELMTNDLNGTTRVVVSTIGGNIFAGNQGDVLYLDVEIDETYRNNGITFDNVIFGTKDAIAREFVVGGNGTTGIGKIEAAGQYVKDSIYNLGGRVVNGIKKGINIITNNDGKTRKVVKK